MIIALRTRSDADSYNPEPGTRQLLVVGLNESPFCSQGPNSDLVGQSTSAVNCPIVFAVDIEQKK